MKQILLSAILAVGLHGQTNTGIHNQVHGKNTQVEGSYLVVAGGLDNTIEIPTGLPTEPVDQNRGDGNVIAGGRSNMIRAIDSTIGGGNNNCIGGWANYSVIPGGLDNLIRYSAGYSQIGGGSLNVIEDGAGWSGIDGGFANVIEGPIPRGETRPAEEGDSMFAWIGGGARNRVTKTAPHSAIGGGADNRTDGIASSVGGGKHNVAHGDWSAIPGGKDNVAHGKYSLAGGLRAHARHDGAFVWGGAKDAAMESERANQFVVCAEGGVLFGMGRDGAEFRVHPGSGSPSIVAERSAIRNATEEVDAAMTLAKLRSLNIRNWTYKAQDRETRHIGPFAEDFQAAFGVGEDRRTISAIDALGVCMVAIQALSDQVDAQAKTIASLAEARQQGMTMTNLHNVIRAE